jgi:organic hydroperoxide reductase OsmC/OhrA
MRPPMRRYPAPRRRERRAPQLSSNMHAASQTVTSICAGMSRIARSAQFLDQATSKVLEATSHGVTRACARSTPAVRVSRIVEPRPGLTGRSSSEVAGDGHDGQVAQHPGDRRRHRLGREPFHRGRPAAGQGFGFNGGQLLALAIGGCLCNDLHYVAHEMGVRLTSVAIHVTGTLEGAPLLATSAAVQVAVEAEGEAELDLLIRRATDVSTVSNSLARGLPVHVSSALKGTQA